MIENKVEKREYLFEIGTIAFFGGNDAWLHHILYDIFDDGENFIEIWIPYSQFINYNII